jgi:hypothetical protein
MDDLKRDDPPEINDPTKKVNWQAIITEDGTKEAPPEHRPQRKRQHREFLYAVFARELGIHAFNLVARERNKGGIHNYINIHQPMESRAAPILL